MKKNYMKPFVDVDDMQEQDMLCLSLQEDAKADDSDALGRDNKGVWDDED